MSLADDLITDLSTIFSADDFAEEMSYTPSAIGSDAFTISGILLVSELDELQPHVMRDTCRIAVRHSDLSAGGVTDPTLRSSRNAGDVIAMSNASGTSEDWVVIDKKHIRGMWILWLERNIRIVP